MKKLKEIIVSTVLVIGLIFLCSLRWDETSMFDPNPTKKCSGEAEDAEIYELQLSESEE